MSGAETMDVYPNPASSIFHLSFNAGTEEGLLRVGIMNVPGQVVYSESLSSFNGMLERDINTMNCDLGIYFIAIEFAGEVFGKLVMVQR